MKRVKAAAKAEPKAEPEQKETTSKVSIKEVPGIKDSENVLIGKFFHSIIKEGNVASQGVVLGSPESGWYLVQLFGWDNGEPSNQQLVPFQNMAAWLFYSSAEDMAHSYKDGVARPGGSYR